MRRLQGYVPAVLCAALALTALFSAPASLSGAEAGSPGPEPDGSSVVAERAGGETDERGNTVLKPEARVPSFDVSAVARFAVMMGETRQLTQPIGYGFGIVMRVHPWRLGAAHFGFAFAAGHLRATESSQQSALDDPAGPTTTRWQRLAMSDFSGALSLRAPLGPVVFSTELGGGLVIGEFLRPTSDSPTEDERYEAVDPSMRAGMWLGAPFQNNRGVVVGVALTKIFSGITVDDGTGHRLRPFDLVTELSIGYQGWF